MPVTIAELRASLSLSATSLSMFAGMISPMGGWNEFQMRGAVFEPSSEPCQVARADTVLR